LKKILFATLATLALSASAVEVGVTGTRDYSGTSDRTGYGITLGQKFGAVGVEAGYDRFTQSTNDQDRYSLVASYDVTKIGPVTLAVKAGVAYLDNQTVANGYAVTAGVGASVPVAKNLAATVDYRRQEGQSSVNAFDGNQVAVGLKYSF
jgi:outer membrane autotransporter protein